MSTNNERCACCDYCTVSSPADKRSFWYNKEKDEYLCTHCTDTIFDAIYEHEEPEATVDPLEFDLVGLEEGLATTLPGGIKILVYGLPRASNEPSNDEDRVVEEEDTPTLP